MEELEVVIGIMFVIGGMDDAGMRDVSVPFARDMFGKILD